jgi:hypothetical protein
MRFPKFETSLIILLVTVGCSKSPDNTHSVASDSEKLQALYNSDINAISRVDASQQSILEYDRTNNRLFTKIFGGTTSYDVQNYYNERIRYALTLEDLEKVGINQQLPGQGWAKPPKPSNPQPKPTEPKARKAEIAAMNFSTLLWLQSVVAGTPLVLEMNGRQIPIESTRGGIMLFGSGYRPTVPTTDGGSLPLPPEYRQAILMHEARHSDCTGGLSTRELEIMRNAETSADFERQIPQLRCGHLHVVCPPKHDYAGIAACDLEKFGAYRVGTVYLGALVEAQTDEIAKTLLMMAEVDSESRNIGSPTSGGEESDDPDMSSSGLH